MTLTKTYNFKQVATIFNGHEISGFAEGTGIVVTRDEDAFTLTVGSSGEPVRSKSNNKSGTMTITLLQSSDSNAILSGLAELDELSGGGQGPFLVKDNSGGSLAVAESAWVQKKPAAEYAAESGNREWVFRTGNLSHFIGGN